MQVIPKYFFKQLIENIKFTCMYMYKEKPQENKKMQKRKKCQKTSSTLDHRTKRKINK